MATPNPAEVGALAYVQALFPWITQLGLGGSLQQWVVQGLTPEAIVGEVRATPQWQSRFAGIRRPDGTLRMNEAEYIATETDYRQLMKRYGRSDYEYNEPTDFLALFNNEIDPNEFEERLNIYDRIQRSSRDVKESFYIYTGMRLTDDQLYLAAVNPGAATALEQEYKARLASNPADYPTYIKRITELGLQRMADAISGGTNAGYNVDGSVATLQGVDPIFAERMVDALHAGSSVLLTPQDLLAAFEASLIGGAALYNGLEQPTAARLDEFRQSGVTRARALQVYGELTAKRGIWKGMLERSGAQRFDDQTLFEDAFFMSKGEATAALEKAESQEKAYGAASAGAAFSRGEQGQIQQQGLSAAYS